MEVFVALVVILVICKILGVSNFVLILGVLGIIELLIILMFLFFVFHFLNLIFTKKKTANFTKFDTVKKAKFKVAFYEIDGVEYPCVFPKESGFSSAYSTEKTYNVRYSRHLKRVYDKWAVATCIIGLIFSVMAVVITFGIIKNFEYII